MTNVSYERGIIVLSFPDIRFVILLLIFLRFEIKSVFLFFYSHCTTRRKLVVYTPMGAQRAESRTVAQ